ncbi:hypothetical protein CTA1_4096 [Colletotrichum tanaceti]|uniref:LysM domain-containing protein n=1 Tax=Colletotrichum tanaceti TaxID=1306861 RepID=A0A4U6XHS5_9PEZI|nr:hypothetical protein CTA1_4096 [Colletotrichum tanaceti]
MRSASILVALTALAGMSAAAAVPKPKRGCRKGDNGLGWYYIVPGDTLNEIAADFSTTAQTINDLNDVITNPDSIPSRTTIVVPCAPSTTARAPAPP